MLVKKKNTYPFVTFRSPFNRHKTHPLFEEDDEDEDEDEDFVCGTMCYGPYGLMLFGYQTPRRWPILLAFHFYGFMGLLLGFIILL